MRLNVTRLASAAIVTALFLSAAQVPASASPHKASTLVSSQASASSSAVQSASTGIYHEPSANLTPLAKKRPGPKGVTVGFEKKGVRLAWRSVKGAKKYTVIVSKRTYYGPYRGFSTKRTSIFISYSDFPYRLSKKDQPYDFDIYAAGGGSTTASSFVTFPSNIKKVPLKQKAKAKSKAAACLEKGAAVFVVTAAAGGTVAMVAIWVPAVGEVTAAGLLAIATATAGATAIACSLDMPV